MFVVHSLRRGHVHIAKCGGTYVRACCGHLGTLDRQYPSHQRQPLDQRPGGPRHHLNGYEWSAVIRNPVDRFRSLWQWFTNPDSPYDTVTGMVYLQAGYRVHRDTLMHWDRWMEHWWHNPIPNSQRGMWNPQVNKIRDNTHLFRFETQLDECVRWMGGRPQNKAINVSRPFEHTITPLQRSRIEQRFASGMTLWESLPR